MRIRVDSPTGGPGDMISFQGDLQDTRSDEVFSLNFGWQFGEKWQLGAQYFKSKGSRKAVLEKDIEWKDLVIGEGSSISAGQEFTLTRVFFARDFATKDRHKFGVGAGFHWLELGASISGNINDGSGGAGAFRTESVSASVPLPNFGAWYVYSISPDWALRTRLDWLSASVGDYDGRLINASLGVDYRVFRNAGVGLSCRWDSTYQGLYAYLSLSW